ncbi:glycosyl hydrolase [Klebsiella pneumoniae]|uniref:glycosyl hydrolase n=1 Tax=Klebsiella pneumoniae TaxID=573 RepID=UPI001C7F08C3|nr:glycosyl hydrolase [Klebsiella pneumoniae]MBX4530901.1 glycoside hydrolase [Klebsiella pneumoniae]
MTALRPLALAMMAALSLPGNAAVAPQEDNLSQQFSAPPDDARPRVWWHWMNGNISKEGISKDLEWMKRAGIGGAHAFDINISTPQLVDRRLVYMTPAWKEAFRFAASKARELNLELAFASSPGWSETGGPWVPAQDAMKKVVWSETEVSGGHKFDRPLPLPPHNNGIYQSMGVEAGLSALTGDAPPVLPTLYRDIAVYAWPVEVEQNESSPHISVNGKTVTPGENGITIPGARSGKGFIELDYGAPRNFRSLTLFIEHLLEEDGANFFAALEYSKDASHWTRITETALGNIPVTLSFSPVNARYYRITLRSEPSARTFVDEPKQVVVTNLSGMMGQNAVEPVISELKFSTEASVNRFQEKAGYAIARDYLSIDNGTDPDAPAIQPGKILNLTKYLRSDGTLDWTPPDNHNWRILRMGYSLTGTTNHPAPAEATGFEVDKYDGEAVKRYISRYLSMYKDTLGTDDFKNSGVTAFVNDSIEVGTSNWTPKLIEQFRTLRGYDPTPWLPTLAGVLVGSRKQSDAFLYDFRKTLSDLIESQHYKTIADVVQANHLITYGESLEFGRPVLGDDLDMRKYTSIPMAAIWSASPGKEPTPSARADIKGAASVSHFYGQNLVASETFTSMLAPWAYSPSDLKHTADEAFLQGMNRPVIHTSPHVPVDDKVPGISLSVFGQYFNRNETWAGMARPWMDYLARTALLLQKGRFYADVAYFYGEEAGAVTQSLNGYLRDVPVRYSYDFVSASSVNQHLRVEGHTLVSPAGATYQVLYLGQNTKAMTLITLEKIAKLVHDGATVVGGRPSRTLSMNDDQRKFDKLASELWGDSTVMEYGRGKVMNIRDIDTALLELGIQPDFNYTGDSTGKIRFVHRRLSDGDIYYVVNQETTPVNVEASFRVKGKKPELWHPETGKTEPVSYAIQGEQTVIPLGLTAGESNFVVFRKDTRSLTETIHQPVMVAARDIKGEWKIQFQKERGAPDGIRMNTLTPLNESAVPGIKYFSGVSVYTTEFKADSVSSGKTKLILDLGAVGDLARVTVNGKDMGTLWHAPWTVDVSGAIQEGNNTLKIQVANLWVNRLIGDAQPGTKDKVTYTTVPTYRATAPLRQSGLIGPVVLKEFE